MPQYRISYGGFVFPYVRMNASETPQYAADKITIEGTNYNFEISGFLLGQDTASFADMLNDMRCALSQPRQEFIVSWSEDGSSWNDSYRFNYSASAGTFSTDAFQDNGFGPFPGEFRITKFMGGRSATYTWSIRAFRKECFIGECSNNPTVGSDVLSFVRRYQHSIDETGLTTRTISGKLLLKSANVDPANGSQPADNFRFLVTPSIPINFHRQKQEFTQSEDGRELSFSFVDVESKYTFPTPITEGQVNFSVRTEGWGQSVTYSLSGKLAAPRSVTKAALLTTLFNIVTAKFPAGTATWPVIPINREITEDVYNNSIGFNISVKRSTNSPASGGLTGTPDISGGLSTMTMAPPNSNGVSYAIYPYGGDQNDDSGVIALPPILYDNCASQGGPQSLPNSFSPSGTPGTESGSPQIPDTGSYENAGTGTSPAQLQSPWIAYHEQMSFEIDNGLKIFLPKVLGQNPIIQQAYQPQVTIIQAGYQRRYVYQNDPNNIPIPPKPFVSDKTLGVILNAYLAPASVEPVSDSGWDIYTVHWRYVIRLVNNQANSGISNIGAVYPLNPRRSNTSPATVQTPIEVVATPT